MATFTVAVRPRPSLERCGGLSSSPESTEVCLLPGGPAALPCLPVPELQGGPGLAGGWRGLAAPLPRHTLTALLLPDKGSHGAVSGPPRAHRSRQSAWFSVKGERPWGVNLLEMNPQLGCEERCKDRAQEPTQLDRGERRRHPSARFGPAPPVQTAAADTGSPGPTGLPQFPRNSPFISVGTFETGSSALSWVSTDPKGSSRGLSIPCLPGPGGFHQLTAFSCHLAKREGQPHWGCPQVSGTVGRGEHIANAQKSGGIEMKTKGQPWGKSGGGWGRWG